ncbi:MAG: cysteine hydrolase [Bacilli bacterium]|nr:cysteine hydrolase [Bacilli bacterium]
MKKMVFVIDMINGFCKQGSLANKKSLEMVPLLREFLNQFDGEKVEARDCHTKDSKEFLVYPVHALKGDYESEGIDELRVVLVDSILFEKNSTNLVLVPGFIDFILKEKPDEVTITGCCTDICIMQFALTLKALFNQYNLGCDIIVYDNLVDTYNGPNHDREYYHEAALNFMRNMGIIIKHYETNKVMKKVG